MEKMVSYNYSNLSHLWDNNVHEYAIDQGHDPNSPWGYRLIMPKDGRVLVRMVDNQLVTDSGDIIDYVPRESELVLIGSENGGKDLSCRNDIYSIDVIYYQQAEAAADKKRQEQAKKFDEENPMVYASVTPEGYEFFKGRTGEVGVIQKIYKRAVDARPNFWKIEEKI
jgi:hypothetical protein